MSFQEEEEIWKKRFDNFQTQIKDLQNWPLTTAFFLPPIEIKDENQKVIPFKDFFLEQRKLYMKRRLLPHRQWAFEKFGVPIEWPRRPAWHGTTSQEALEKGEWQSRNLLMTTFGDMQSGKKDDLSDNTPIYQPFDHPSWTDKMMKSDRGEGEFLANPENVEWYNMMPSVLRQVRLGAKPKRCKDSDGNWIWHEREGLYNDENGVPVPAQEDLSYEDYMSAEKRQAFRPAWPRRKRGMILLKALQHEKIQPEHLMHGELDVIIYQLLKMNRFDPDIPNKRGKNNEKATYRARQARAPLHYVPNERSKSTRLRGYLEWFWRETDEGREIMRKKRLKNAQRPEYEASVRESLRTLQAEIAQIRTELDVATENIDTFSELIDRISEVSHQLNKAQNPDVDENLLDRRWKWLMYKEDKLKDLKKMQEIVDHFEFRLSDWKDPRDAPDSKFGTQHFAYTDLAYDSAWLSDSERANFERVHQSREPWDTDATYQRKLEQKQARAN